MTSRTSRPHRPRGYAFNEWAVRRTAQLASKAWADKIRRQGGPASTVTTDPRQLPLAIGAQTPPP